MDYQVFVLVDENGEVASILEDDEEYHPGPVFAMSRAEAEDVNDGAWDGRMRIVEGVATIRLLGPDEPAVVRE